MYKHRQLSPHNDTEQGQYIPRTIFGAGYSTDMSPRTHTPMRHRLTSRPRLENADTLRTVKTHPDHQKDKSGNYTQQRKQF